MTFGTAKATRIADATEPGSRHSTDVDGYRAWVNAIAVGICGALGTGVILFYSFGVLVTPIAQSLGASPALVGTAVSPAIIIMALLFPLCGTLIDRWGVRRVALASLVPYTIAAAAIGLAWSIESLTVLLIAMAILGTALNPNAWVPVICEWFQRRRGSALGVSAAITGVGVSFVPVLTVWLLAFLDWRTAILALAVGANIVIAICLIFFVRSRIDRTKAAVVGEQPELPGLGLRAALRTPRLYILCTCFLLMGIAIGGAVVHLPSYLAAGGLGAARISLIVGTMGLANIAGRLLVGLVIDRIYAPYVSSVTFMTGACALLLFAAVPDNFGAILVAASLLGVAIGAETTDMGYLVSASFGPRHNAQLFGFVLPCYSVGQGAGAGLIGLIAQYGGYKGGFLAAAAGCLIATILILTVRRKDLPFYPEPAVRSARSGG